MADHRPMTQQNMAPREARAETEIFDELQQLCCSTGFIHAISYLCWRDDFIRFSGEKVTKKDVEHRYSHERLLKTEISTLIGLMAKGDMDFEVPEPRVMQSHVDRSQALLHEMHLCLQKPWAAAFEAMKNNPVNSGLIDPFRNAEGLREAIFYSGESAYGFQYLELAVQKYGEDNNWLTSNKKFSIEEACVVAKKIGELQVDKMLGLREEMRKIHPDKWTFLPGFVFAAHELEASTELSLDKVERILGAFTLDPISKNASFSDLSSFNEVNARPIIKTKDGAYILLQQYSLFEALYEAPFFWMAADKNYSREASTNRGVFVEEFLAKRLLPIFGSSHVFRGVEIYRGKNRIAEVDVLVVFGDRVIVVQAKSKRLTIEARKGNDSQLKVDFKKAIQDSYNQALLCSESLLDESCRFYSQSGKELHIPRRIAGVFPLCVVADHFPALAAQARQFLKTKETHIIQPPMVTDVFFVDVLTEMLSTPLQLINYMVLRAKFDNKLLVNQELTILGYHLMYNLWLEEKYNLVHLNDDFTYSLDIAMSARRLGIPGDRTPRGILSRFDGTPIGKLISEFESSGSPELVGIGMLLIQIDSDTAKHINNGIERLVKAAAEDGLQHDMSIPSSAEKSGFTIHVSPLVEQIARERLSVHCRVKKYESRADSWYGLLLAPATGDIRNALRIDEEWRPDADMEKVLELWPKKPMLPLSRMSTLSLRRKIGRNQPCPCGSGKKFKRCCSNNS